jgi:hypothetical protein
VRPPHILRGNKGAALPVRCIFLDTETRPESRGHDVEQAVLWFGAASFIRRRSDGKWTRPKRFEFTDAAAFWEWVTGICPGGTRTYLFAHNLGFDFTVVDGFNILPRLGWSLHRAVVEDPPTILTWRREKATLCGLDTLNFYPMSLAKLGEAVGLDKLPMPSAATLNREWREYNRRDVEVIERAMLEWFGFVVRHNLGNFAKTLPAQAFGAFRHRFMKRRILIDSNPRALNLARRSYVGARVEARWDGAIPAPAFLYDVNSMYASVMAECYVPIWLRGHYTWPSDAELSKWLRNYEVIADVDLEVTAPALPYRGMDRLVFPVGSYSAILAAPELRLARKHGWVRKARSAAVYERAPIFREYVDYFWVLRTQARLSGDAALDMVAKLFLNSLYGKFGQRGRRFEEEGRGEVSKVEAWTEYNLDDGSRRTYRQLGDLVQQLRTDGESHDSHPAIASTIVSAARVKLWRLMNVAGPENVLYVDTDSLMVNQVGADRLERDQVGDGLGELKLQTVIQSGEIRGQKDYTINGERHIKGIRRNAVEVAPGEFKQETFRGLKGQIADGELGRQLITTQVKKIRYRESRSTPKPGGPVGTLVVSLSDPPAGAASSASSASI